MASGHARARAARANPALTNVIEGISSWPDFDEETRQWWYLGLNCLYRLVAASRNAIGPRFGESGLDRKSLYTVSVDHPICAIWREELGDRTEAILDQYLPGWTTISVVRIGFTLSEAPTVIWIGVDPERAGTDGARMTIELISTQLARRQLHDVVIEIKESVVSPLSGFIDWRREKTDSVSRPFTVPFGAAFSSLSRPQASGTLGLSVTCDSDNGPVDCFLTAQHCLVDPDERRIASLHPDDAGEREQYGLLLDSVDFQQHHQDLARAIQGSQVEMSLLQEDDAGFDAAAENLERLLKHQRRLREEWSEEEDRIIGDAYAYAPLSLGKGRSKAGQEDSAESFTLDYGLIAKRPDRFNDMPVNIVRFDRAEYLALTGSVSDAVPVDRGFCLLRTKYGEAAYVLPLAGTRSIADVEKGSYEVVKIGCRTGLTKGKTNAIMSRVRRPYTDGTEGVSRELLVISVPLFSAHHAFSYFGDSGSTVFDLSGRILGVLTSGSTPQGEKPDASDEIFVTPIEIVLRDLANYVKNPRISPVNVAAEDLAPLFA